MEQTTWSGRGANVPLRRRRGLVLKSVATKYRRPKDAPIATTPARRVRAGATRLTPLPLPLAVANLPTSVRAVAPSLSRDAEAERIRKEVELRRWRRAQHTGEALRPEMTLPTVGLGEAIRLGRTPHPDRPMDFAELAETDRLIRRGVDVPAAYRTEWECWTPDQREIAVRNAAILAGDSCRPPAVKVGDLGWRTSEDQAVPAHGKSQRNPHREDEPPPPPTDTTADDKETRAYEAFAERLRAPHSVLYEAVVLAEYEKKVAGDPEPREVLIAYQHKNEDEPAACAVIDVEAVRKKPPYRDRDGCDLVTAAARLVRDGASLRAVEERLGIPKTTLGEMVGRRTVRDLGVSHTPMGRDAPQALRSPTS